METVAPYRTAPEETPTACPCIVGIDPGAVTGMAVWDPSRQAFVHVGSGTLFETLALVGAHLPGGRSGQAWEVRLVVVEDARRLPIYAARDGVQGRQRDRLCRRVGHIDRDVQLWETWLRAEGVPYRLAEPHRGPKWDAETLARMTQAMGVAAWTEPTNEHGRDAARLVFGTTAGHLPARGKAITNSPLQ